MDERDYNAMNSENNSLGNLSEMAVDFYLWMNENGFDHNIKQRVKGKFKEYYRTQLLKLNKSDVISSLPSASDIYLESRIRTNISFNEWWKKQLGNDL